MFKNQLHPITIFSCFVLAISIFSLGIAGQILLDELPRYDYTLGESIFSVRSWSREEMIGFFVFLGIGAFLLTAALGLMFYKSWARYLMQFAFVVAGASWLAFLSFNSFNFNNAPVIFIGITAAILGFVLGALLFLNNTQWVLPYFRGYAREEVKNTILDQEFTSKE